MNKRKAIFKWYRMSVTDLIAHARKVVAGMTGNATYTTPAPTLAAITTATDELEAAQTAASDGGKELTAIMNARRDVLIDLLRQLCDYVNNVADGDEVKVLSSGFDINKLPQPIGTLPAPLKLEQVMGKKVKGLKVRWGRVYGSRTYLVQRAPYTPGLPYPTDEDYRDVATVTKARIEMEGLRPGTTYLVRTAAIGTAGRSDFSSPLQTIAL